VTRKPEHAQANVQKDIPELCALNLLVKKDAVKDLALLPILVTVETTSIWMLGLVVKTSASVV